MPASDPFLVRAVQHIRDACQDVISEVRWPASRLVELIDHANAMVFDEILAATEPKTYRGLAEATITITSGQEDYQYPANCRRILRLVRKNDRGAVEREILPVDLLSNLGGMILFDEFRGFRLRPIPTNTPAEDWTLQYEAGVTPYLCYGSIEGTSPAPTSTTCKLKAPTASQLGTLSVEDSFYTNSYVRIVSGTGAGQMRRVTDYDGATGVITVDRAWATTPDGTSVYEILPCLQHPDDKAIMWRAAMMLKAADTDTVARAMLKDEYRDAMRTVLMRASDRQARTGPSTGSDFMELFDYGET